MDCKLLDAGEKKSFAAIARRRRSAYIIEYTYVKHL